MLHYILHYLNYNFVKMNFYETMTILILGVECQFKHDILYFERIVHFNLQSVIIH